MGDLRGLQGIGITEGSLRALWNTVGVWGPYGDSRSGWGVLWEVEGHYRGHCGRLGSTASHCGRLGALRELGDIVES